MDYALLLSRFLDCDGRLVSFPSKRKMKIYALYYLASKIPAGVRFSEPELGDLLDRWHLFHDPATLRRELYNHRFIDRERDGSAYWLEPQPPTREDMERRYGTGVLD